MQLQTGVIINPTRVATYFSGGIQTYLNSVDCAFFKNITNIVSKTIEINA